MKTMFTSVPGALPLILLSILMSSCASGGRPQTPANTTDVVTQPVVKLAPVEPPPAASLSAVALSEPAVPAVPASAPAKDPVDEFALVVQLLKKGTEAPAVIQEHVDKGLKGLRDKNNAIIQKKRDDFAKDERKKRDEFENGLKKKRAEYLKKNTEAEDRKEFAIEQGEELKEFLLEQADIRKEFAEETSEARKTLEADVQETQASYAQKLSAYAKAHKSKH